VLIIWREARGERGIAERQSKGGTAANETSTYWLNESNVPLSGRVFLMLWQVARCLWETYQSVRGSTLRVRVSIPMHQQGCESYVKKTSHNLLPKEKRSSICLSLFYDIIIIWHPCWRRVEGKMKQTLTMRLQRRRQRRSKGNRQCQLESWHTHKREESREES
jgi:hypothetical protein